MATKVVNNIPNPISTSFEDIELGHFFLDGDGDLCIRTGPVGTPNNAFYFDGNIFVEVGGCEKAIPVNVTISIDGYGA